MKILLIAALMFVLTGSVSAAIHTETVEYHQGDAVLEGYLAYDDTLTGPQPGVLVIHAWDGLGDYVKSRCKQLAELGYVAFGADIYGKGVRPTTREECAKQATIYRNDRPLMRARAQAGLDQLLSYDRVDRKRVATIGYCFGGGVALELARSGANLAGVATFHGDLSTPNPDDAKNIVAKVLVMHGADDPYVDEKQVAAFEDEMRNAKVDWQLVEYGNAVHSFTIPTAGDDNSTGSAYNAEADRRSWAAMRMFFGEIFK